jgi:hypothetical protein
MRAPLFSSRFGLKKLRFRQQNKNVKEGGALKRFHLARAAVGAISGIHQISLLVKRDVVLEASNGDSSKEFFKFIQAYP